MQILGSCKCDSEGCECPSKTAQAWVDSQSNQCRNCETDHGERWGHHDTKVDNSGYSSFVPVDPVD